MSEILRIKKQGTFSSGGLVQKNEGVFDPINGQLSDVGQIRHSDHANIFYQIPEDENGRNIMFLHGFGGSKTTWQTTEYCEGFSDMFLKEGYSVYLIDQPRRASAGQSSVPVEIKAKPDDLTWFTQFRLGLWDKFQEGTQFPVSYNIDQFFRMMTPDTGAFDVDVIKSAIVSGLEKIGESILMTHSQGGLPGWIIGTSSKNVNGIIAIEPGTFVFPEDECPKPKASKSAFAKNGYLQCVSIPKEQFLELTKKPIVVYFGDYIPNEPSNIPVLDHWRVVKEFGVMFADCINKHGGNAKVVYLPDEGIKGNSHFLFQEKNNKEIFNHILSWMKENNL